MADLQESSSSTARGRSPAPPPPAASAVADDASSNHNHVHFHTPSVASISTVDNDTASKSTSAMTSPLVGEFMNADLDSHEPRPSKTTPLHQTPEMAGEDIDDDDGTAPPFQRAPSPGSDHGVNKGAEYGKVGDQGVCKMHKFSLYETATRYYLVGTNMMDTRFRILKIDRTADAGSLSIAEDDIVYSKKEMSQLLNAIDDGNKGAGGMHLRCSTWGLLGFIRFTGPYYMLLITKRSQVAMIGGHFVYSIDGTEMVPLTMGSSSRFKPDTKNTEETRFLGILNNLDLTRSFYFSYSYNITRTLQHNIIIEREAVAKGISYPHPQDFNSMFVWNSYLLQPAAAELRNTYDWCIPVMHGYIDQSGKPSQCLLKTSLTRSSPLGLRANCLCYHYC